MKIDKKQFYNDLKREVAYTLAKVLFGRKSDSQHLRAEHKRLLYSLMKELDKTFREHGVDWRLTE